MLKQCKCGREIHGQNDYEKESKAVVFAKNKNDSGFVMHYQSKHRHWECDYCKRKRVKRKRDSQVDRVRQYEVKEIPTRSCFIKKI